MLYSILFVFFLINLSYANLWTQLGADIDGEAAGDESGKSVSLSADGNTLAIGAWGNDGNGDRAGHVRVYSWGGSAWTQLGADIDGEAAGDYSGAAVSLSTDGSTVAIGGRFNDGNGSNAGHVRVYSWGGSAWTQLGADIDGEAANDRSGWSVSLSADGSTVAIGAYYNDGNGINAGHVRVYSWGGSAWTQLGADIDGEYTYDYSSWSVSLSADGSTVAIGAHLNDGTLGVDWRNAAGHVRVYSWGGSSWTQLGADIDGEAADDYSGWSVSLSADGTRMAIGAKYNGGNGGKAGHVRVYSWDGSAWTQFGADIDGEAAGDESGFSVSLSADGNTVAIGAAYNGGNGDNVGHVRLYSWDGSAWTQFGTDIDGEAAGDNSGYSVSLSADGTTVAIGAYLNDGNGDHAGHVRVLSVEYSTCSAGNGLATAGTAYADTVCEACTSGKFSDNDDLTACQDHATCPAGQGVVAGTGTSVADTVCESCVAGTSFSPGDDLTTCQAVTNPPVPSWTQLGADIDGEAANDRSGWSASLSADGSTVAIGAYYNDGNGINAGHVRVYSWGGSSWTQLGADIDGEAAGDNSGASVSLSADGSTVAIGAYLNDGTGDNAGHVRVYSWGGSSWTQLGADIDGEAANDYSSWSVSLSADGTTMAIGAYYNDGNGSDAGHVRVYSWGGSAWAQLGADIDGEAANDRSGWSVSLSADGNTVAIGAYLNDGTGDNAGHVRVYSWGGSSWTQLGADIDGEAAGDQSGYSVSLSADGNTMVIGAWANDGNGDMAGHVRVYSWGGSAWTQVGADIDGEAANDRSGWSASLSADGNTLAFGAPSGSSSGHVRVYSWDGSAWTQVGTDIDGEAAGDWSGAAVSLSADGSTLAIGAAYNAGTGGNAGHVRVLLLDSGCASGEYLTPSVVSDSQCTPHSTCPAGQGFLTAGTAFADTVCESCVGGVSFSPGDDLTACQAATNSIAWTQLGADIDGEAAGDESGKSVSLSADGNTLAIGAWGNDGNGDKAGHVRVYSWGGSAWTQLGADIDGEAAGDYSGAAVSLSTDGNTVAIGAYLNDGTGDNAGHVRVYSWGGSAWTQLGADIDGEAANDYSSWSVSLSADGTRMAIGAPYNDDNGGNAGHVRVYSWGGSSWTQLGADIDGEAADDNSGYSVSLSTDGSTVAIGGRFNDGNGSNAGHVRVYSWGGSAWTQLGADIDGEAIYDNSGWSVSLSADGSTLAIGAPDNDGNDSRAGHVRVYSWGGSAWAQLGADIDAEAADDRSGFSVSLSADGTTMAIGAYYNDGNGDKAGHVRVYSWGGSSWTQLGTDIDGEASDDYSGAAVSLSADGSTVAIGAKSNDGNGGNAGHVRVIVLNPGCASGEYFTPSVVSDSQCTPHSTCSAGNGLATAGTATADTVCEACITGFNFSDVDDLTACKALSNDVWTQLGADIDGEAIYDSSGKSVSLSADGTTMAIGAYYNDGNGDKAGHVRVYSWGGSAWTQLGADIDGEAANDRSGWSVSLSADGNTVAIGANGNDGTGTDAGHVRVYSWGGSAWTQLGADIDGEASGDWSGAAVSLSADGNTVAIGASGNDDNGTDAGHVRVYSWGGSSWTQLGADIDGGATWDGSGFSVSLSADGSMVAIGAYGPVNWAGHVRVYSWGGSAWTQLGADIDGEATNDESGSVSLSADGSTLAIGSEENDGNGDNAGHVRVYSWGGSAWTQLGADIDGEAIYDQSGSASLSADGSTLAIGGRFNDGNGNAAGHVRVYSWGGSAWTQLGADIDGEAANDYSGWSVSLSADGSTLAIGAPSNDGNGVMAGHVRVLYLDPWCSPVDAVVPPTPSSDRQCVAMTCTASPCTVGETCTNYAGGYTCHVGPLYAANDTFCEDNGVNTLNTPKSTCDEWKNAYNSLTCCGENLACQVFERKYKCGGCCAK